MEIVSVPLKKLVEDPANARIHDEKNIEAIKASLREFGQVEPLVVRAGSNIVVGGNGRLAAMRSMGWETTDVHYQDLSDAQAAALGIALNRTAELAEWDQAQLGELLEEIQSTEEDIDTEALIASLSYTDKEIENLIQVSAHLRRPSGDGDGDDKPPPLADVSLEEIEDRIEVHHGDCIEVLKTMGDGTIDAIVTDPPAGIGFMGKDWDGDKGGPAEWVAWMQSVMVECLRVLKPGGHALVWSLPRTSHWTGTAIEGAGFEIRDQVYHIFGTGFPKSLNVSMAIDAAAGATREVVSKGVSGTTAIWSDGGMGDFDVTAPSTAAAKQWDGWGTALKPAAEVWWLARKPLVGTVAANVLEHGTGALNIDGTRVGSEGGTRGTNYDKTGLFGMGGKADIESIDAGRWPAHVTHDGSPEVMAGFPDAGGGYGIRGDSPTWGPASDGGGTGETVGYGDSGSAARFFYCSKPSTAERDAGLTGDIVPASETTGRKEGSAGLKHGRAGVTASRRNDHPTVKPIALMRWLTRLITPPGGTVLDPFMGSGTTGIAALQEGFSFVGIEQDESHYRKSKARILAGAAAMDEPADP